MEKNIVKILINLARIAIARRQRVEEPLEWIDREREHRKGVPVLTDEVRPGVEQ